MEPNAAIESEIVASWMQVVELQTDSCIYKLSNEHEAATLRDNSLTDSMPTSAGDGKGRY